jgi:hypothetical protein
MVVRSEVERLPHTRRKVGACVTLLFRRRRMLTIRTWLILSDLRRASPMHEKNSGVVPRRRGPTAAALACYLMLSIVASTAEAVPITCVSSVSPTPPPTLDPLSESAAIGNLTITCGGDDPATIVSLSAFFNVSVIGAATPLLSDGVNTYEGTIVPGGNQVVFSDLSIDPRGVTLELENIFVNPLAFGPGTQILAFVSLSSDGAVALQDPQQLVAVTGTLPEPVPEPGSALLMLTGFAGLWANLRRRRARRSET